MRINTTPTHEFVLPFAIEDIEKYSITYKQDGAEILKKSNGDDGVSSLDKTISIAFTQEEAGLFAPDKVATAQVKIMVNGDIAGSEIIKIPVKTLYDTTEWEVE